MDRPLTDMEIVAKYKEEHKTNDGTRPDAVVDWHGRLCSIGLPGQEMYLVEREEDLAGRVHIMKTGGPELAPIVAHMNQNLAFRKGFSLTTIINGLLEAQKEGAA